jgi:hypothetical protein
MPGSDAPLQARLVAGRYRLLGKPIPVRTPAISSRSASASALVPLTIRHQPSA